MAAMLLIALVVTFEVVSGVEHQSARLSSTAAAPEIIMRHRRFLFGNRFTTTKSAYDTLKRTAADSPPGDDDPSLVQSANPPNNGQDKGSNGAGGDNGNGQDKGSNGAGGDNGNVNGNDLGIPTWKDHYRNVVLQLSTYLVDILGDLKMDKDRNRRMAITMAAQDEESKKGGGSSGSKRGRGGQSKSRKPAGGQSGSGRNSKGRGGKNRSTTKKPDEDQDKEDDEDEANEKSKKSGSSN